ncbi:MAG: AAA family ATPase [Ruminococcus sp.]|nr:AAA family ATPase [Ruminococcus sp.]
MNNKGTSILITSAKGGVGKTLTTLNLAGVYEILEKKVLIIDFDLSGGGIAAALNVKTNKSIYNLVEDVNNNRYSEFKNYVASYDDFIDVLPSPKDPRQASKIDPKYIELILDKAIFNYDIVLIDTNHILNDFNILTMDLVDNLLFIITNDPLDLKNMRSLISILNDIDFNNYKVVLNESIFPFKKYFSLYDIKSIIKANVDYVISKDFYIKNIDSFIMNGKIVTLDSKAPMVFAKDYTTLMQIVTDLHKEDSK